MCRLVCLLCWVLLPQGGLGCSGETVSNSSKSASCGCVASQENVQRMTGDQHQGSRSLSPFRTSFPRSSDPLLGHKLLSKPGPCGAAAPSAHLRASFFLHTLLKIISSSQISYSRWVHPAGRVTLPMGGEMPLCSTQNGGCWWSVLPCFFQRSRALPSWDLP